MRRPGVPGRARHRVPLLTVSFAVLAGLAAAEEGRAAPAPDAAGGARKAKVVYCTRHRAPRGCVRVPKGAKRAPGVSQQGSESLTPPDVENGGGLGGGPGDNRRSARQWARTQIGEERWRFRCQRFVEEAFGTRGRFDTALAAARAQALRKGPAPAGSLVYFGPDAANRGYGHVGIALGRGRMVSALDEVEVTDIARSPYWRGLYLGWTDAPAAWPGRIPLPPGPTTPFDTETVRITAPGLGEQLAGVAALQATTTTRGGVAFDAYYSTTPEVARTARWHRLGKATARRGAWGLEWDTRGIPDQGDAESGFVHVAATALDARGRRTGARAFRRVSVANTPAAREPVRLVAAEPAPAALKPRPDPVPAPAAPAPAAAPQPQSPSGPDRTGPVFAQQTGGPANTWTDPKTAGGENGQQLEAEQVVGVRCRLQGFKVNSGNTWWYRLAESPWDDVYYATADAFYNQDDTSVDFRYTPFVDERVPICP